MDRQADFALAFWMAHEVRNLDGFVREIYRLLNPGGYFLLAEPAMHVSAERFQDTVTRTQAAGMLPIGPRKIRLSQAMLFQKPQ